LVVFMLGAVLAACMQPGGPVPEDFDPNNEGNSEFPEGWEDWKEETGVASWIKVDT
jgi:hypothetical protein